MKVTACYVVKNEGRHLKKSLDSIRGKVDEIVLVDTGSTDDTKEIGRAYGAKIYEFPWQDDFSEARNFALGKLETDWVVAPDGDEYFSQDTAGNLRRVIETARGEGKNLLLVPWHNIDEATGEVLLDSHAPRIFRWDPGFRYEGRIHEELRNRGKAMDGVGILSPKELVLVHTGYSAEVSKEKARRNVDLLLKELEEREEPGNLYMYLAEAYDGLEEEEEALKYARLDVGMGRRNIVYASRSWRILLRRLAARPTDREEHGRMAAKAAEEFPELPEFHGEYAESLAFGLDFPGALREAKAAERALKDYGKKPRLEPMIFDEGMLAILKQRRALWEKILLRAGEMKITSCLIVRDGEEDMESWLENTARFSDQRVVVDTGSKDRTVELARAEGCLTYEFPWKNDFAQAKNEALRHASGEWIAFLDVDEAFEKPEQVRPYLAWLENCSPATDAVMVSCQNIDADDGNREVGRCSILRLFRNHKGLRYQGNVHEVLRQRDGGLPEIYQEGQRLCLRHWGYSTGRILKKTARNLVLLQEDIANHGERPWHYRYLADCYAELGDWEKALLYAQKSIDAPVQSVDGDDKMEDMMLMAMRRLDYTFQEQELVAEKFCKKFPSLPDFHGSMGILLAEQGEDAEALPRLEKAVALASKAASVGIPSEFDEDAGRVCGWLALLYHRAGRREKCETFLKRAMDLSPEKDEVLDAAREILKDLPPREFRQWLATWLPVSVETDIRLWRWAERNGHANLCSWRENIEKNYGQKMLRRERCEGTENHPEGLVAGVVRDVRRLVMVLLRLEAEQPPRWHGMAEQCTRLLPEPMEDVWRVYKGRGGCVSADGFQTLWPMVRATGSDEQLAGFGKLAMTLGVSEWRRVTGDLMADEKWGAARALFEEVPAESPLADGEFWRDAGICLWHGKERDAAKECFRRAREAGVASKAMDALEFWGKEATG